MITPIRPTATIATGPFDAALRIAERSGADRLLDSWYELEAGRGGRRPEGIEYTVRAVLIALILLMRLQRPATLAAILQVIGDLTETQLEAVGMRGQDTSAIHTRSGTEYQRFYAWLQRRLKVVDPDADLAAKRTTNREDRRVIAARSPAQQEASALAAERLHILVNRLVFGSVAEAAPVGSRGDLVVDESIFDVATHVAGLGVADDKRRSASSGARMFVRDTRNAVTDTVDARAGRAIKKIAMGIGLTAITRVGEPSRLHAVPPVIIAISIHAPTSGSPSAIDAALKVAEANGITGRRAGSRAAWPLLTVDMGYNPKRAFADLMIRHRYAYVGRYPATWKLIHGSKPQADGRLPGVIQVAGDHYCPAARVLADRMSVPSARSLVEATPPRFAEHDALLARILPLLMGRHTRPRHASTRRGRPRIGAPAPDEEVVATFVCPAAMGRVRCPLKPESLELGTDVPMATPDWPADRYLCCENTSVTIGLTTDQLRMVQWSFTPGSWEHLTYFEAARALTEQMFSQLKSRSVTGLRDLTTGPRRVPMMHLILAAAVAATNDRRQEGFEHRPVREESIDIRMRQLEADLGHRPTRTPPRT